MNFMQVCMEKIVILADVDIVDMLNQSITVEVLWNIIGISNENIIIRLKFFVSSTSDYTIHLKEKWKSYL